MLLNSLSFISLRLKYFGRNDYQLRILEAFVYFSGLYYCGNNMMSFRFRYRSRFVSRQNLQEISRLLSRLDFVWGFKIILNQLHISIIMPLMFLPFSAFRMDSDTSLCAKGSACYSTIGGTPNI